MFVSICIGKVKSRESESREHVVEDLITSANHTLKLFLLTFTFFAFSFKSFYYRAPNSKASKMLSSETSQEEFEQMREFVKKMKNRFAAVKAVQSEAALKQLQTNLLRQLDWFFTPNGFIEGKNRYFEELLRLIQEVEDVIKTYSQ